jgi:hypothetical protein
MTTLNNTLRLLQLQIRQSHSPDVGAFGAAPYHPGTPTLPAPQVPALSVHNGLNKNDLHDPSVPVAVQVVLRLDMLENDDLTLYLNDTAVAVETLRPEHVESGIVTFYLLPSVFPQDGQVTLHYHHTVPPSTSFSVSHNAGPFLVKQSVPGNPDPDPSTPYVNEHLTPPTGVPATVTPGQPLTVTIPRYANIAENDEIVLHWSNQEIRKTVTAAEASNPSTALTITVSADIIDNTPGLGLIVRYEIHDTVMNWSLYSLEAHADVDVPGSLHVPTLPQTNDYDQLDMDDLAGADVTVQIPVTGNNMPAGTQGTLTWTGQPILGPQLTYTAAFRVEASASRVTVKVPNANAAALAGSSVTVYYDAIIGGQNKRSHRVTATVIGQPVTLAQPRLTGVTGNTFNPDIVTGSHQEVIVPAYGFMASGQTIQLHWKGQTASGTPMYTTVNHSVTSNTPQDISLLIDKAFAITLGTGRVLEVYYEVTAQGVSYVSPTLQLTVVGIPSNLPKPTTEPVFSNGEIDPGAIVDAIKVVVEPNSTLAPGDLLTVKWLGRSNASIILTDQIFPSSGNLEIRIGKTPYIDGNTNGYVDVSYEARRNGQPVGSSQVLQLHVGEASEQPWPLPKVVDATNGEVSTWQPVKPGTSYESNTATVVVNDSRILAGDTVAVIWRLPGGTDLTIPWMLAGAGEGRVPVPAAVLARSLGQTVQVGYVVFRGAGADLVGNSGLRALVLQSLRPGMLRGPQIVEATSGQLDLNTAKGNATVLVEPWPFIQVGQTFWLRLHGLLDDGTAYSERLPTPYTVQASEATAGVRRTVSRTLLLRLENASKLRVELKVNLVGAEAEASATLFPTIEVSMLNLDLGLTAPIVESAENGYLDPEAIEPTGVDVRIPAYSGREIGQRVYAEFIGQNGSKEKTPEHVVSDVTQPINFKISKAEVIKNLNNAVTFEYLVARSQGALFTSSTPLPIYIGANPGITPPSADGFEDLPVGVIASPLQRQGYQIRSHIINLEIAQGQNHIPYVTGKYLFGSWGLPSSAITFDFDSPVKRIEIGLASSARFSVYILHIGGKESFLAAGAGDSSFIYSIDTPSSRDLAINYIRFDLTSASSQYIKIDNLAFDVWAL